MPVNIGYQYIVLFLLSLTSALAFSVSKEPARSLDLNQFVQSVSKLTLQPMAVKKYKSSKGNNNAFTLIKDETDRLGINHKHYQQYFNNIPVYGQKLTLHKRVSGPTKASGFWLKGLAESQPISSTQTRLTNEEASDIALTASQHKEGWIVKNLKSKLYIYFKGDQTAVYAYVVEYLATPSILNTSVKNPSPQRPVYVVDANTGEVISHWDNIKFAKIGTGPGGNEKTGQYEFGADYDFLDVVQNDDECVMESTNVKTVNLNHGVSGTDAFVYPCARNTFKAINGAYSPINDAHFFGNLVFNMFQDWLGEKPLTFQLVMRVHYSTGYENAFWDGSAMTFGDGRDFFYPLVDVNISAHEVAHGYTEQNSDLIYASQSGGINEAFSDMAGEAAEYYWRGSVDWLMGADVVKQGEALRYFEDPTRDGQSIGHADDYIDGMDVHFSSGVYNRAFYLIANDSEFTIRSAFELFAYANRNYWTNNETFNSAACGVLESAVDLRLDVFIVDNVFKQVGVDCGDIPFEDEDDDKMSDYWEVHYGLNPNDSSDAAQDLDNDGLSNLEEYLAQTSPLNSDTDQDGLTDSEELTLYQTSPVNADSDTDQMPDGFEVTYALNPLSADDASQDADGDNFSNLVEFRSGTDPRDADSVPVIYVHKIDFENGSLGGKWSATNNAIETWSLNADDYVSETTSLSSNAITNGQAAVIDYKDNFSEAEISFWLKTSTEEGYDFFALLVDGRVVYSLSGMNDWQKVSIDIPSGEHILSFAYIKDGLIAHGDDRVWIDDIEFIILTNDKDNDGMPTAWELANDLNPDDDSDASLDNDNDGLINFEEFQNNTNPNLPDTDFDGLTDDEEVSLYQTNPNRQDTDSDGINDGWEVANRFNPLDSADASLDKDEDGLSNLEEFQNKTSPTNADTDADGLTDAEEIKQYQTNPLQTDTDSDGLSDGVEVKQYQTNPLQADTDADHMADGWEVANSLNATEGSDAEQDADNDGLTNLEEFQKSTNPNVSDTDADGVSDFEELVTYQTNPLNQDTDSDGMVDGWEILNGFDPLSDSDASGDKDNDGLINSEEFKHGTNPSLKDTDTDGLTDGEEVNRDKTDPLAQDSDLDGLLDGEEVNQHKTNPLNNDTDADGLIDSEDSEPLIPEEDDAAGSTSIFVLLMLGLLAYRRIR